MITKFDDKVPGLSTDEPFAWRNGEIKTTTDQNWRESGNDTGAKPQFTRACTIRFDAVDISGIRVLKLRGPCYYQHCSAEVPEHNRTLIA